MVRRPCCENMGLKKGPWTKEEDQILISHIHRFGHSNWRALPKQAGLMRCGKSCRLRWTNYLRPDIKRGNFSSGEEQTIIKLHELVGNRWSTIAARLPGRTDNEIKNYWHITLKKKVQQVQLPSLSPTKTQLSNFDLNTAEISYCSTVSYDLVGKKSNNKDVSISQPQLRFSATDDVLLFWYDMYLKAGESMVQEEK